MNISTDGMIAAIRSAAERVEPRESEVLNGIADRIADLVASSNKNRRTAKHYERECSIWRQKYHSVVTENAVLRSSNSPPVEFHDFYVWWNLMNNDSSYSETDKQLAAGAWMARSGLGNTENYQYTQSGNPIVSKKIDEFRAQGVERFAQYRNAQAYEIGVSEDNSEITNILDFAARLREGAQ